jgi:DNA-binding NarL/FixJ family response regulator
MNRKTTVLIVDDHPLFREGVKALVGTEKKYDVVGEADNGADALRKAIKLKPELMLVDLSLPDTNGIEVIREIKRSAPDIKIIMLTMHSRVDKILKAFKAGAAGYALKDTAGETLLQAMDAVAKGEYFMDTAVSRQVIEKLTSGPEFDHRAAASDTAYDTLTPREKEIMIFLAEGNRPKEVAQRLGISPKTVENHRSKIMRKLDLKNGQELVRYAARLGLIDLESWKG